MFENNFFIKFFNQFNQKSALSLSDLVEKLQMKLCLGHYELVVDLFADKNFAPIDVSHWKTKQKDSE